MSETRARAKTPAFRLGVNYWPARSAMRFWSAFDGSEVHRDFSRVRDAGFHSVRIFLSWEEFQPSSSQVDTKMLNQLVVVMEQAAALGLAVMPTLFTGHMSGVNWIPAWAMGQGGGDARFRNVSGGKVCLKSAANWYTDRAIGRAQARLATEVSKTLKGHDALWAWDLGNENSNCGVPPDRVSGRAWLLEMSDALRTVDPNVQVTIGLHMEDLEEDRKIGPSEAAEVCDFLTMHGYPGYAAWTSGPTDQRILPFLTRITSWLAGGAPVLFSEFGVPTTPDPGSGPKQARRGQGPELVLEEEAASYVQRGLNALLGAGSTGAMLWCYSDYDQALWGQPPLDLAHHERSFGLWRADGSPKPAVGVVRAFSERKRAPRAAPVVRDDSWLDLESTAFYRSPRNELARLYERYCDALARVST